MQRFIADKYNHIAHGLILDTEALSRYSDVIDMSIGDPDLTTDKVLIEAAMKDAMAGYTRYGDPNGDPELIREICRWWKARYKAEIGYENVSVTNSAGLAMMMSLLAVIEPGDEVIVLSPHYPEYSGQIALAGGKEVEVALKAEEGFAITKEALEAAATSKTKALIFNNPVNPSGVLYERETLQILADFAKEHDILILADEIYTDFIYGGTFESIRNLPGMEKYAVSINSFSKNYLMTGWRVGFIVAEPELLATILRISDWMTYCAPSISQRAAIKALQLSDQLCAKYIPIFKERVMYGAERLAQVDHIDIIKPRGTFYLFPSIKRSGMTSAEYCSWLLNEKHILATPGSLFGKGGEGCIRLSCTVPIEKIKEAMDRF